MLTELGRIGKPDALDDAVKLLLENRPSEQSRVLHAPLWAPAPSIGRRQWNG